MSSNWVSVVKGIIAGLFKLLAIILSGFATLAMTLSEFIQPSPGKVIDVQPPSGTGNPPGNGV